MSKQGSELQLSGRKKDAEVTSRRRDEIENLMLHGTFRPIEASRKHGVHINTIYRDVKKIEEERKLFTKRSCRRKTAQKQAELQFVMREAITQWEESKKETTERIVTTTPTICPQCKAEKNKVEECSVCNGEGQVEIKKVVKKTTRATGNPAHLTTFLSALQVAAKLDGLYPSKKKYTKHEYSGSVQLQSTSTISLENADPDAILDVLEAVERLKRTPKAIDVESKPG